MRTENYTKGDVITAEGEHSEFAYYLRSGSVEIIADFPEGQRLLGEHTAGDFFGEMGLIMEAPRMATVRALTDVVVEAYDLESFEKDVIDDSAKRAAYLPNLFERMRLICGLLRESMTAEAIPVVDETDFYSAEMPFLPAGDIYSEAALEESEGPEKRVRSIHLKTLRPLQGAQHCVNVRIEKFPFYIGRTSGSKILVENDFYIEDRKPYMVSRGHCSIEQRADSFVVRDRFSSLGTTVNGQQIGKSTNIFVAPLQFGENELILGNAGDRYSFFLEVE
ncbi:MAG: cyclic nucleotide-binding domain-containing protein [Coraliomargaritaceae bacterium]